MPIKGWERRKIGEFAARLVRVNTDGSDLPPLSITKDRGVILQSEKYHKRIATDPHKYVIAEDGDFAFDPMSLYYGSIGRVGGIGRGLVSPDYVVFSVDGSIDHAFLTQLLRYPGMHAVYENLSETSNSFGKRRRLYWSVFREIELNLPPLPEQKKIAAILSSVDEAIQATQAVIDQTRRVKEGLLQDLLTRGIGHTRFKQTEIGEIPESWEVKRLDEAVDADRPVTYGIVQTGPDIIGGVPCVRVVDLVQDEISVPDMIRTTGEISSSYRRTVLRPGDIMMALRGDIGHVRLVDSRLEGANLTRGVALVAPASVFDPRFLLWALRSPATRADILRRVNGSALQEIPLGSLRQICVPKPPKAEQACIAERLDSVERTVDDSTAAMTVLRHLKSALLTDLLTGRVRVTP